MIVGNKTDLIYDEKILYDEAIGYAKSIGAMLKLTSCKENKGINELFNELTLEPTLQNAKPKISK